MKIAILASALGAASAIKVRSNAAVLSATCPMMPSVDASTYSCMTSINNPVSDTSFTQAELAVEGEDVCCTNGELCPSTNATGAPNADQCYLDLCSATSDEVTTKCNAVCSDISDPCYWRVCMTGGLCDQRKAYLAALNARTAALIGGRPDEIANCTSIMMTDDCSECGCHIACAPPIRVAVETPCAFWCGRTLESDVCDTTNTDLPESSVLGGGCFWDTSYQGVCEVETVVQPITDILISKTIYGCVNEAPNKCTEYYADPTTGVEYTNAPCSTPADCATSQPCDVQCNSGVCDGAGTVGAKCRATLGGLSDSVAKEVNPGVTVPASVFPGATIPTECPGRSADGSSVTYNTYIYDHNARLDTCSKLSRTGSKCFWVNKGRAKGCISNMCSFLNTADKCTIQNSGGRCVWYEKTSDGTGEEIANPRRPGHKGCFTSPCNNPVPNRPWKCNYNGADPGLAGCNRLCTTAKMETSPINYNAMTNDQFFELFPMCDPRTADYPCPCLSMSEIKSTQKASSSKLYKQLSAGDLFSGRDEACDAQQGTCVEILKDSNNNNVPCALVNGKCPPDCTMRGKHDQQYNERYCPYFGACMPADEFNPQWWNPGNKKAQQKLGRYYVADTGYTCAWIKEQDAIGDGTIGCQNSVATSSSSGNNVECDSYRVANPGTGGACPSRPPFPTQCYSNPWCSMCQPCAPAGGCNPYANSSACDGMGFELASNYICSDGTNCKPSAAGR